MVTSCTHGIADGRAASRLFVARLVFDRLVGLAEEVGRRDGLNFRWESGQSPGVPSLFLPKGRAIPLAHIALRAH
jgi:hypothetical protein